MKPLIISHSYLAEENRKKLKALADITESCVYVATPSGYTDELFEHESGTAVPCSEKYTLKEISPVPGGSMAKSFLIRLRSTIQEVEPDLIALETDLYTIPTQQVILLKMLGKINCPIVGFLRQPVITNRLPGIKTKKMMGRIAVNRVDGIQVVSKTAQQNVIKEISGSNATPSKIIYQIGVDPVAFAPTGNSFETKLGDNGEDATLVVGYCGRIIEKKGITDLIQAVADTQRQSEFQIELSLLGNGPAESAVAASAEKCGVNLTFHDTVPHSEVPEFLRSLDIFVLPSRETTNWIEHDAHAAVEAMACGIPVIGSTSGVIPEVLGGAGMVFKAGNRDELIRNLTRLVESSQLRDKFGLAGRERVEKRYTHSEIAKRTIRFWESIIGA